MSAREAQPQQGFDTEELERISTLEERELDDLPFGAIQLDDEGNVLAYNASEARWTGRRPETVVGKDFFREVAPCTNVQEFAGKYRQGVRDRNLHVTFPYLFDYKMTPRRVWVTLFYSDSSGGGWVFVRERGGD